MPPQLIFVYNADSGLFNTITDIAHKILSPATYACQLCNLTHSYFTVKKDWSDFLAKLDAELEFLHRDELVAKYGSLEVSLPAILLKQDNKLRTWIGRDEINCCAGIDELKELINSRLQEFSRN